MTETPAAIALQGAALGASAPPQGRATLVNVQALRALAAFLVVFVHIQPLAALAGAPPRAFVFGNSGVDLFFVISGFIMVFTTGRRPMGSAAFFASRIRRIAPLYWTVTLAVFALALVAPRLLQSTQADPRQLVASLLFLPFQRGDGVMRPVVFVGWTLNYEMAFYLLFAIGLTFRPRVAGVALTCALLAAAVAFGLIARPASMAGAFYTAPMILEFGLGMLLGLAWPRLARSRRFAWGMAGLGLIAFAAMLAAPGLWPGGERALLFGLPAVVMVAAMLVMERSGLVLRSPILVRLGDASYAIYLTHFFVTQLAVMLAYRLHLHGLGPVLAFCAVTFLGVAIVGLVVHAAVERRLEAWLRALTPHPAPQKKVA